MNGQFVRKRVAAQEDEVLSIGHNPGHSIGIVCEARGFRPHHEALPTVDNEDGVWSVADLSERNAVEEFASLNCLHV
ncbi:hypothetical protein [Rhizobium leguminosarum]|uniref:hypothetical protein n=1 Tax=Rhizobium leguminosarum TaxID=384 RepID=UPI001FEDABC8|nr:hypothetical protein [Rhizobium leguminosarum]